MTFYPVLPALSGTSTRPGWSVLVLCLAGSCALTLGCYQDAPAPTVEATVESLIALLTDRETAVRLTAAEALGKIGDQKGIPVLLQALHDSEASVREAAARSIGKFPSVRAEAGAEVLALLRDPDASVRRAAAEALGAVEASSALTSALGALLSDPDPAVRQAAGHALLLSDTREAVAVLSKGATDPDPVVRRWAVAALGESGDGRAVPVLLDRLRHDAVAGVRTEAAYRLQFVAEAAVAAELEAIIQQESDPDVKRWAGKSRLELGRGSTPVQRLD